MGKIQEVFEKKKEIEAARKNFNIEDQLTKDTEREDKELNGGTSTATGTGAGKDRDKDKGASKRGRPGRSKDKGGKGMEIGEEDLDEGDDDLGGL